MNSQVKNNQTKKCLKMLVFCLSLTPVITIAEPYAIPAPPNMLEHRVELVEPQGVLSLSESLSLALLHNPSLQSFAWGVRIADVKALRAGFLPNPELTVEGENFLGSRQLEGFDQIETTFSISQLFELGGKRSKREALAKTERDLVLWDYEAQRMDMIYQVATRYIHVLANQARLELALETTTIAEEIYNTSVARVEAGMVSPLEQGKARVELAKAKLHKARVQSELVSKKQNLAAVWGSVTPLFKQVSGDISTVQMVPELPVLLARLNNNPDLARWAAEIERYRKAITLAKAQKIPNITFMAGGRHFAEGDDFAVVAGISAPLFIFDTQQTGVDEAEMILTQAMQKQRAAKVAIRTELIKSYQQLQLSLVGVNVIREDVLPSANQVLKAAKIAYRLGEIGSLDLLDAQRTSFQTGSEHLEALADFQLNVAKIERLMGGALNTSSVKMTEQD